MELKKDIDGKYYLEFDEVPAFIYVHEESKKETLLINGKSPVAWRKLTFSTAWDEAPMYELEAFSAKEKK